MRVQIYARILLLAAFAGAMTELALSIPPRTTFDVLLPIVILVPLHLGLIALSRWMWRQAPDRWYLDLGLPPKTWSSLNGNRTTGREPGSDPCENDPNRTRSPRSSARSKPTSAPA